MKEWLQCVRCGSRFDIGEIRYRCQCEGLLGVERDALPPKTDLFDRRLGKRGALDRSGVWRFRPWEPLRPFKPFRLD